MVHELWCPWLRNKWHELLCFKKTRWLSPSLNQRLSWILDIPWHPFESTFFIHLEFPHEIATTEWWTSKIGRNPRLKGSSNDESRALSLIRGRCRCLLHTSLNHPTSCFLFGRLNYLLMSWVLPSLVVSCPMAIGETEIQPVEKGWKWNVSKTRQNPFGQRNPKPTEPVDTTGSSSERILHQKVWIFFSLMQFGA